MMGNMPILRSESMESSVGEYLSFLARVGLANGAPLVPTLMVDLVWHVHQQHPGRYNEDCLRVAGRLVDHDDDVDDDVLLAASQ